MAKLYMVNLNGIELNVLAERIPEEKETRYTPRISASFEIKKVFLVTTDITNVLEEFSNDWHEKLNDKMMGDESK